MISVSKYSVVILLFLLGCTDASVPDSPLNGVPIEITIATDATFPPFHYVEENGEVTGFDVELARQPATQDLRTSWR